MTQSNYHSDGRPSSERMRNEKLDQDSGRTFEEEHIARERAEDHDRAQAGEQVGRMRSDEHRSRFGSSFLASGNTDEPWQQWRQIQADFVDNPQSAVSNAHRLVGELMDDIVRKFENERNQMEQRWSSGEDVSTEDLRRCLQTYRDFFGRLLANVGEAKA